MRTSRSGSLLFSTGTRSGGLLDEENRRARQKVQRPATPQEAVSAIHTPVEDLRVAAAATGDLMKSPITRDQVRQGTWSRVRKSRSGMSGSGHSHTRPA
ncbi:DUF6192 family protein [Streptomyces virginiae]|uniref:DUF6192 family protein n=1 Tax=Streptomyces virginiae TaxID=1961 RepID=UPI003326252A